MCGSHGCLPVQGSPVVCQVARATAVPAGVVAAAKKSCSRLMIVFVEQVVNAGMSVWWCYWLAAAGWLLPASGCCRQAPPSTIQQGGSTAATVPRSVLPAGRGCRAIHISCYLSFFLAVCAPPVAGCFAAAPPELAAGRLTSFDLPDFDLTRHPPPKTQQQIKTASGKTLVAAYKSRAGPARPPRGMG